MLNILRMNGLFDGLDYEDPNKHLKEVCLTYNIPGKSQEGIRLSLFPLFLKGKQLPGNESYHKYPSLHGQRSQTYS